MSDNLSQRGGPDGDRVNVHEKYELQYWTERFGVSADELKRAAEKVGPMVRDIEKELQK